MSSKTGEMKLFDNKQLIHIASEVVVLIGLTFYFSSKNKKLLGHVEELAQKLEEQEDRIQKLETNLQQTHQKLDIIVQQMNSGFIRLNQEMTTKQTPKKKTNHTEPIVKEVKEQPVRTPTKVQFTQKPSEPEEEEEEEEEEDSDLDDEIRAELEELVEDDSSLKKEK